MGAGKAGTTSLWHWLAEHRDVCMSVPKEPNYFSIHYHEPAGPFWERHFRHYDGERVTGEATPGYLHLPYVPERIRESAPLAKIVMTLRHPVERAYSDWWMHHARGDDYATFDEAMRICEVGSDRPSEDPEECWRDHLDSVGSGSIRSRQYLEIGYYADHVSRYRATFGGDGVEVVFFDDIVDNPAGVLVKLHDFLGLEPPEQPPRLGSFQQASTTYLGRARRAMRSPTIARLASLVPRNLRDRAKAALSARGRRPPIPPTSRARLLDHYRDQNLRLESQIGRDLSSWRR